MDIVYLIISFVASCAGAICGIGGGVIIKPVLDAVGI
ncbi:MAG: sulfite exporter TauE/SafE family protein, partial [Oscillospiraceae bacterium]